MVIIFVIVFVLVMKIALLGVGGNGHLVEA